MVCTSVIPGLHLSYMYVHAHGCQVEVTHHENQTVVVKASLSYGAQELSPLTE